jgi:hypothetical protein
MTTRTCLRCGSDTCPGRTGETADCTTTTAEPVHHVTLGAEVTACCGRPVTAVHDDGDRVTAEPGRVTCPGPRRDPLPYEPPGLRDLIGSLTYKPGWVFNLRIFREDDDETPRGWRFHVISDTPDSFNFARRIRVNHAFPIPPASWNRDTWAAWLFDRIRDVESHEAAEFFRIDGVREFAPHHGNGEDPYRTWFVSDYATAAKSAGDD